MLHAAWGCQQREQSAATYPLQIWQVLVIWPVLFSWAAHKAKDLVDLLHLALAVQQRRILNELAHDTTHAPHVDGG